MDFKAIFNNFEGKKVKGGSYDGIAPTEHVPHGCHNFKF